MKNIVLVCLCSLSICTSGQEYVHTPKLKAKYLIISQSITNYGNTYGTLDDFHTLAPNSEILSQNLSGFRQNGLSNNNVGGGLNGMLGLAVFSKKRNQYIPNCTLRLGLQGSASTQLYKQFSKDNAVPIDTLYSAKTETTVYIDSFYFHYISMYKNATNIVADVSLVYNSNEEKRIQIHGGIGVQIGASIASRSYIEDTKYESVRIRSSGSNYSSMSSHSSNNKYLYESYRNKTGVITTVYFPLGYNFRLSNKKEFLKNIYLFGEIRPLIHFEQIPELYNIINTGLNGTFGIRFNFAKKAE